MSRPQDPSDLLALRRRRLLQGAAALPAMGLGGLAFGYVMLGLGAAAKADQD